MRSAKANCSTASFSTPSGFSSSRWGIRVTIPSRDIFCCTKSSAKKVCATGAGSAKPVVSMMTPSSGLLFLTAFLIIFFSPAMRSPRTVQQMQPLFISMMFSCVAIEPASIKPSSMPTSPNSFSMMPMRLPWFSCRMRFSSVVFPLPRNPVSTVTGTLLSEGFAFIAACTCATLSFNAPSVLPNCCAHS
eukprot:s202_g6.t1